MSSFTFFDQGPGGPSPSAIICRIMSAAMPTCCGLPNTRGLHSSTIQLNVSTCCGIRGGSGVNMGGVRGCVGRV